MPFCDSASKAGLISGSEIRAVAVSPLAAADGDADDEVRVERVLRARPRSRAPRSASSRVGGVAVAERPGERDRLERLGHGGRWRATLTVRLGRRARDPTTRALNSKSAQVFERTRCWIAAMYVGLQSFTVVLRERNGRGDVVAAEDGDRCAPSTTPLSSLQSVTGNDDPWWPSMTVCRYGSVPLVVCAFTVTRFSSPAHTSFFSRTMSSMTGGGSGGPAVAPAGAEEPTDRPPPRGPKGEGGVLRLDLRRRGSLRRDGRILLARPEDEHHRERDHRQSDEPRAVVEDPGSRLGGPSSALALRHQTSEDRSAISPSSCSCCRRCSTGPSGCRPSPRCSSPRPCRAPRCRCCSSSRCRRG